MAFLSADRNHQENRYAYRDGDPINNVEPLGLSWASFWASAKGWDGLIVGGAVKAGITGDRYGWKDALLDGLAGAASGLVGAALEPVGQAVGQSFAWGFIDMSWTGGAKKIGMVTLRAW